MNNSDTIKGFLIFEKRSGRPYINRTYPGFNADPFLLISFLNAMIKFAKEAMIGRTEIKMIDMQDLRFAFIESKGIIFTAISSNRESPLDLEFKIKTIESLFFETFTEKELRNPALSLEHYKSFNQVVDEVLKGEVRYIHPSKAQRMKKILLEFKNKQKEILGLAIISFTGIVLVNCLKPKHYELVSKIINSLFSAHLSGMSSFKLELHDILMCMEKISIDSYLIFIFNKNELKSINHEEYNKLKQKITEILEEV